MPIDVFSSGNHIWDKKEIYDALNSSDRILRPANYPPGNPGRGFTVQSTASGIPVGVLNLQGQVFMPVNADSPFRVADEELARGRRQGDPRGLPRRGDVGKDGARLVPGRARLGRRRHAHARRDRRRDDPSRGTAYLTDAGMTGAYEGIIGFARDRIIEKFLSQTPRSFETAKKDIRLSGCVIAVDEETGKATGIERVGDSRLIPPCQTEGRGPSNRPR